MFSYSRVTAHNDSDDDEEVPIVSQGHSAGTDGQVQTTTAHKPPNVLVPSPPHASISSPTPPTGNLIDFGDDDDHHVQSTTAVRGTQPTEQASTSMATSPRPTELDVQDEPSTSAGMIDMEIEDSAVSEKRELVIYAIPLYKDKLVYLPVCNWSEAPPEYTGRLGKIQEKIAELQDKALDTWHGMKEKEPDTFQHKVYKMGQKVVENLTPEERLTRNIPKHVTKVIIYHPASVQPDTIMEELTANTASHGLKSTVKAAAATLMLPIAFGIDIIIIPGPQVLTYYTLFQMYKNTASAVGTQRLTKYIAQDGKEDKVRVNYAGDSRLDKYAESVKQTADGVLSEEDIEAFCEEMHEHSLLHPLLELRDRRLDRKTKKKGDYAQLPAQAS